MTWYVPRHVCTVPGAAVKVMSVSYLQVLHRCSCCQLATVTDRHFSPRRYPWLSTLLWPRGAWPANHTLPLQLYPLTRG